MKYAIELDRVVWSPGKAFRLDELSLRVPRGSIYGFLGPNGSGKTTTIRLFMGMVKPHSGEIRVLDGRVPRDMAHILSRVGYVPERPHVYPQLTVGEAMRLHAAFHRLWDPHWADELVERLGLDPDRKIARMSKGETGKLLVSLALAQRPDLLVLDEPTDGLDPVIRRDVISTVLDYVSESGASVFISSHLVHELERICDWVGVMDRGSLVAELPMTDFKNGIKHLRVETIRESETPPPFTVLDRKPPNGVSPYETWVVRDWMDDHTRWFDTAGTHLRDVVDLDLEDGFVELLRSQRAPALDPHGED
ncbi:ABC transporter ATP-binding protein [Gaopeijia maritima]|uniref:ABC transporter ATP-binding protein n=1 Tax=Gaopeijia maritima TaxID=3119007 RepID=UPI00324E7196